MMTPAGQRSSVHHREASGRPLSTVVERILLRCITAFFVVLFVWLTLAYVILPGLWKHYEHHPPMENAPKTTLTSQGIVGDPLTVGFFGSEKEVVRAMLAANWNPADPVTWKTSVEIAESVLLKRPYPDAPVSSLFVFGRTQDMAFEKAVGGSPRHRHHARFWKSVDLGREGLPLWIGSATYDRSVGFSHRTGQVTHHIAPDIDAERDELIADLVRARRIAQLFQVTGIGATVNGHNGGGDWYYTDGEMTLGVLTNGELGGNDSETSPEPLPNPAVVKIKDQFWDAIRPLLEKLPSSLTDTTE